MPDRSSGGNKALAADSPGIDPLPLSAIWQGLIRSSNKIRTVWLHPRSCAYLIIGAALLALLSPVRQNTTVVNSVWFLVTDAVGVALALVIGFIAFAYYRSFRTRSLLFLSIGFIGSAIIDSIHIIQILGLDNESFSRIFFIHRNWSSQGARLFLVIMMLVGWRASEGRILPSSGSELGSGWVVINSVILLTMLLALALVLPGVASLNHPTSMISIAKSMTGLLYLVLLFIFLRRGDWRRYPFQHWLVLSLILFAISQSLYVPLVERPGDFLHLAGNGLRVGGDIFALIALLGSTSNLFRQASAVQLEDRINALISQNANRSGEGLTQAANRRRVTAAATFELDLATGQFKGNRVTIELLGGLDGANASSTLNQFVEILHPEDHTKLIEALRRSQVYGELFKQQFRLKVAGGYRWFEAVAGMESVDGKPARLLGMIDDVTERKSIELEKERLYRELNQIIDALDHYAVTATLDLDGVIRDANELFCKFCGLDEEEMIGRRFDSVIVRDTSETCTEGIRHSMRDGRTWKGLVTLLEPTDLPRIANASLMPHLDDEGKIDAYVFMGIDVSTSVANTRALRESIEAHKKSNDELQLFAHIVSHDLQEPLRMVSSFMTLLERRHAADLNAEAREFVQFAVEGSTRMRNLLDGLLEYSRVRSRGMVLEQLSLNNPATDAVANLGVLIRETGAEVSIASLPEIRGDAARLMQLFQNLIANSIKFRRADPPKIQISSHREERRWVVEVSDNGIGIEPAHYHKIFQIFSRLHSREAYPGTGLGLAVCQQIMERHGGCIEVKSTPGQGTTFRLCF